MVFIREAASCNACLLVLTALCSWVSWDMASDVYKRQIQFGL